MATNPTKILLYDLDEELVALIKDIIKFKGSYPTLYERLTDLTTDTFDSEVQTVIDDLINGYQNGGILTIERLKRLENKSELSEKPKFEEFSYDTDKDIELVSTFDKADPLTRLKLNETLYEYSTVNGSKEIVKSTTSILEQDGITIAGKVIKKYSYDIENNVKSIETTVI